MKKMKLLLTITFINSIFCLTEFNGTFQNDSILNVFITKNNALLMSNPHDLSFYKADLKINSVLYENPVQIYPEPFENKSIDTDEVYFGFRYTDRREIEISYFNEKYASKLYVNLNETYSHFSLEEVGPNQLILFSNSNSSNDNSTIQLIDFNATAENEENKLIVNESYSLNIDNIRTNSHCILTSSNKLVCGLIVFRKYYDYWREETFEIDYNILLLNNNTFKKLNVHSRSSYDKDIYFGKEDENGVFENNYIKMVPLEDDKVFYCLSSNKNNMCGLIQISNQNIKKLIWEEIILSYIYTDSYSYRKNIIHALKFNDSQIILSAMNNSCITFAKITILNNNILNIDYTSLNDIYGITSTIYYLKLLKNNNDDLILVVAYDSQSGFQELSYSTCNDYNRTVYNGDRTSLSLEINPAIFKNKTVGFFNNGKKIYSLINRNNTQTVNESEIYIEPDIYFELNFEDYDEIHKYKQYSLEFSSSSNESEAQRCRLTLHFFDCDEVCELCTSDNSVCYDRYWNIIYIYAKTNFEKFFFIAPTIILGMLVVLIIFSFGKCCCMKKQLPNYGGNAEAKEIPLITM